MPTPSFSAINATLALRRWSRRQQAATGQPVTPETVRDRAARVYRLEGPDLEYAAEFGRPVSPPLATDYLGLSP